MSSKNSRDYQKWGVILIGVLFLTSMAGVALNSSSSSTTNAELPKQYVLSEDVTDAQRALIYSKYGSVVILNSDPSCGAICLDAQTKLESLSYKYQGYVYLVLLKGEGNSTINIANHFGDDVFGVEDASKVEDKLCEIIGGHPACIERRAMSAVFYVNTTAAVNDTSTETGDVTNNGTVDADQSVKNVSITELNK